MNPVNRAVPAVAVAKGKCHTLRRTAEHKVAVKGNAAITRGTTDHVAMTADHVRLANNVRSNRARKGLLAWINLGASVPHVAKANNRAVVRRVRAKAARKTSASLAKAHRRAKDKDHDHKASAALPATTVGPVVPAILRETNRVNPAHSRTANRTRPNRTMRP